MWDRMTISPRIAVLRIRAPLERADLPGLVLRTCAVLGDGQIEVLSCEVTGVTGDAVAVDALARLALEARRRGCRIRLRGASRDLIRLVHLVGLAEVLGEE